MNDIFTSFSFDGRFDSVFNIVREVAAHRLFNALRIDQASALAQDISDTIIRRIRDARLVIADITGNNPNVLNEVGLAQAFGKPLVLLSQDSPSNAPFNIRKLQILQYDPHDVHRLRSLVDKALAESTSPNELLRAMLVPSSLGRPTRESWFVIAASPLSFRRVRGKTGGYKKLRRTSSDYVGVRGILQSFGLLFGFDALPDNLDPEDCDDCVLQEPMNIYCIASPKANRWTNDLLCAFADRWVPRLHFRADPISPDLRNVRLSIYTDEDAVWPRGWNRDASTDRYQRDFGIIVRGPNPFHENHMFTVVAGRSSLGTEAASTALTDPKTINRIRQRLSGHDIDLENHKQPFWALMSMKRQMGDEKEEAIRDSLELEGVESFRRR